MKPVHKTILMSLGIAAAFASVGWAFSLLMPKKIIVGPTTRYLNHALSFSIEVPEGYQVRTESNGVVIVPRASWRNLNPAPVMQIRIRPAGDSTNAPTGATVVTKNGKSYVMSLWRGAPWALFNDTASSFTFVK